MLPAFPKPGQIRKPRPAVKVYRDGREVCDLSTREGKAIYEHRKRCMVRRQKRVCPICKDRSRLLAVDGSDSQYDHEHGRGMDAAHQDDRIYVRKNGRLQRQNAAVHPICNSQKGSKRGYGNH